MHLAFQGDISRVFTFMIGHEAERPRLRAHRHPRDASQHLAPRQRRREAWPSTRRSAPIRSSSSAEFLEKLKTTKDGDGNLLDHSLLYWGSGMSNGNQHDRSNPPAVLVGGAHGRLKGNRHIAAKEASRPRTCCWRWPHLAGAEIDKFGASTGRLDL